MCICITITLCVYKKKNSVSAAAADRSVKEIRKYGSDIPMMVDVIPFGFLMVVRWWCRQTVSGWCRCGGGVSINGSGGDPFCSAAIIPVMICQVFARNEEMANRFVELPSRVHLLIILARRNESAARLSQLIPLPLPLPMLYHRHLRRLASRRLSLAGKSKSIYINARISTIIYTRAGLRLGT